MVYYNGAHSMTFFDGTYNSNSPINYYLANYETLNEKGIIKNSWKDWNLIPCDGEYISPPIIRRTSVDIPGRSGSIDISTSIAGYPLYQSRTGSFEFYFASKNILENGIGYSWSEILSEISKFFRNYPTYLILEDDKFFYYEGYFSINSFKSDKTLSKIVIDYNLYPYKRPIISTNDNYGWLWDPFDFNKGYIQDEINRMFTEIHDGDQVKIICGDEPEIIKVECSSLSNIDDNRIAIKPSNENKTYYQNGSGTCLLDDLKSNINVEKILTFNFTGGGHFDLEIDYVGGYL